MQARRVGRIPEDRMGTGLITTLPLSSSMVLPRIGDRAFSRLGILKPAAIRRFVSRQIRDFGITAAGTGVRTGTLSGGNLQKALLARELAWDPLVLLAAQPTRGRDVAAAQFVYRQFLDLRSRGRAVVLISEDLEELFLLSDRIAETPQVFTRLSLEQALHLENRNQAFLIAGLKLAAPPES